MGKGMQELLDTITVWAVLTSAIAVGVFVSQAALVLLITKGVL